MNAPWFVCLLGTIGLAALMAFNGFWRRYPALFTYLWLIAAQSFACWALWSSHAYFYAYYGFNAAQQLVQLWIMVEISTQVTAAGPRSAKLIRCLIPSFAGVALVWPVLMTYREHAPCVNRVVFYVSHAESAVSLAWALTLTFVFGAILALGVQFSQGARGIACGFLIEVLAVNLATALYVHTSKASATFTLQTVSYGATLTIWTASLWRSPLLKACLSAPFHFAWARKGIFGQW